LNDRFAPPIIRGGGGQPLALAYQRRPHVAPHALRAGQVLLAFNHLAQCLGREILLQSLMREAQLSIADEQTMVQQSRDHIVAVNLPFRSRTDDRRGFDMRADQRGSAMKFMGQPHGGLALA
jgi:hypothetical protein